MRKYRRDISRLALAGVLALATVTTACSSDDDGDNSANVTTTAVAVQGDDKAWCDASRAAGNATTSEELATFEAVAELAPEELAPEYETLLGYFRFRDENPGDAVGLEEQRQQIVQPLLAVIAALETRCGMSINLFGE